MNNEKIFLWPDRKDVYIVPNCAMGMTMPGMPSPKRPAVIVCPGGAYLFCSPEAEEGDTVAAQFYAAGYQTFVLKYTVASDCGEGSSVYPAPLHDVAKAFLYIREHQEEFGVDVDRISVCGFSAGGHLCASWAVHWHDSFLAEHFGVDPQVFKPQAAILGYPICDYVEQMKFCDALTNLTMVNSSNKAIFGEEKPSLQRLEELSPCRFVDEHSAPVFMVHASDDDMVPALNSINMAAAYLRAGRQCELHMFQQGGHGFATAADRQQPSRADKAKRCAQWVPLAISWLARLDDPEEGIIGSGWEPPEGGFDGPGSPPPMEMSST